MPPFAITEPMPHRLEQAFPWSMPASAFPITGLPSIVKEAKRQLRSYSSPPMKLSFITAFPLTVRPLLSAKTPPL